MSENEWDTAPEDIGDPDIDYSYPTPFEYQSSDDEAEDEYYSPPNSINTTFSSRPGNQISNSRSSWSKMSSTQGSVASSSQSQQSYKQRKNASTSSSTPFSSRPGSQISNSRSSWSLARSAPGSVAGSSTSHRSARSQQSYKQRQSVSGMGVGPLLLEEVLNECKLCHGPGCGFYVCDCRGQDGVMCLSCLELTIRSNDTQQDTNDSTHTMVCPDCQSIYFGLKIIRGQPWLGMESEIVIFCQIGPLVIFGIGIVLLGVTHGWSHPWVKVFAGLLLFIYIFEFLVFGYCAVNQSQSRQLRSIRITPRAIRIRDHTQVEKEAPVLLNQLQSVLRHRNNETYTDEDF